MAGSSPAMTDLESSRRSIRRLAISIGKRLAMAMTVDLPALERTESVESPAPAGRLRRYARPALGLLLPVGLALIWEFIACRGWSTGRLLPRRRRSLPPLAKLGPAAELPP